MTADWFVGSITIPAQSFTANGFACSIAAGTYYLRHTTSALSLIGQFATEVENQTGVSANGVTVKRSRLIADSWTGAVAVTWGSATQLRDLFGHTGDLASATDHIAPNVSPLLWSPGFPATPATIRGKSGYIVPQQAVSTSDDGQQSYTYHFGTATMQEVAWTHIDPDRMAVATGTGGGTYHEFHRQCAMLGYRFLWYQDIVEDDDDSSTDVTWTTQYGPYILRAEARSGDFYRRNQPNAELSAPLELPLHVLAEYS